MPPRKRIKEASTTHAVKEPASMFFASHRPEALHTPEAWKLSEDAMGGGKSEVTRAIVSLHLRTADSPMMQLKSDLCLLVLVKLTPSTHEIQLHDNEKVLVVQPLLPSLVFAFNTVSDSFKLNPFRLCAFFDSNKLLLFDHVARAHSHVGYAVEWPSAYHCGLLCR
jgi:hypothetical protein